jgi:hypothetical protein
VSKQALCVTDVVLEPMVRQGTSAWGAAVNPIHETSWISVMSASRRSEEPMKPQNNRLSTGTPVKATRMDTLCFAFSMDQRAITSSDG